MQTFGMYGNATRNFQTHVKYAVIHLLPFARALGFFGHMIVCLDVSHIYMKLHYVV